MALGRAREAGSVIILLFVLVSIFGAISYAFLQNSQGGIGWLGKEKIKASSTGYLDCANALSMAQKRLAARGCGAMVSNAVDGSNSIIGAPTDGSCSIYHANGGGLKPCVAIDPENSCATKTILIGELCNGAVFAGITPDGGKRMFTTPADGPQLAWGSVGIARGTTSATSGFTNTATLAAFGAAAHPAAKYCDDLTAFGYPDWYLPSYDELANVLYVNRAAIGGFSTDVNFSRFYSSTESAANTARTFRFADALSQNITKSSAYWIRCVRREN